MGNGKENTLPITNDVLSMIRLYKLVSVRVGSDRIPYFPFSSSPAGRLGLAAGSVYSQ